MDESAAFGKAVACQLAKLHTSTYQGCKDHPTEDADFDNDNFFAVMDEVAVKSDKDGDVGSEEDEEASVKDTGE